MTSAENRTQEHWQIRKPAVTGADGLVATQHYMASDVGADILRAGGNAIDAAVGAGLALGTVEPWMSGIGGGGYMTVYLAAEKTVRVVEFGMRAPLAAPASDYPLAGGATGSESFNWPAVVGDVNVHGPLAVAVPGYIKGISLALAEFGTKSWAEVIAPACALARDGLPIDWYSAQKINTFARDLSKYDETRRVYLSDGLPPTADLEGELRRLQLGQLGATYAQLRDQGPESYYSGDLAHSIAADLEAAGSRIRMDDLAQYRARIAEPVQMRHGAADVYCAGPLTAGPSLMHALSHLGTDPAVGQRTDESGQMRGAARVAYANALLDAYEYRLNHLGEGATAEPTNTTHICVADRFGNVVSLTQTIMSGFGARVMLPGSGILMNNGMMWFDPRPGGPNSVVGGRHPLCNMCPALVVADNGSTFAVGACGGRKIFPAVFQLISFMLDYGMSVDEAVHEARIDVSGTDLVSAMSSMDDEAVNALRAAFDEVRVRDNGVSPNLFALPQLVQRQADGSMAGGCFIPSPHAKVSAA